MKRLKDILFSIVTTSLLLLAICFVIAYATFIEHNFDTQTAKALIYNSQWFNMLSVLIVINLTGSLFYNKLFSRKKWSILLFHLAFIIIIIGSAITRFYSYEGIMHLRENQKSNQILSTDTYLTVDVSNGEENKHFESRKIMSPYVYVNFTENITAFGNKIKISGVDFHSNALEAAIRSENGVPIITLFIQNSNGRQGRIFIKQGEITQTDSLTFSFENKLQGDINFSISNSEIIVSPNVDVEYYNMFKNNPEYLKLNNGDTLSKNNMHYAKGTVFNLKSFIPKAEIKTFNLAGNDQHKSNLNALICDVDFNGNTERVTLLENPKGLGIEKTLNYGDTKIKLSFNKKNIVLPFYITLNDFILEKYLGSNSPASYKSLVKVEDEKDNTKFEDEIFMNNILDYKGYRFFQNSFDQDEQGSILSVNFDFYGTTVTYIGYFLMILGITFAMFNRNSRFIQLIKRTSGAQSRSKTLMLFILLLSSLSTGIYGQTFTKPEVDESAANEFGKVLVVDLKGRLKPINTLSSEILRKLARKNSFMELNSDQVLLDMSINPQNWKNAPILKVSDKKFKKTFNINNDYTSYNKMISYGKNGELMLNILAEEAQGKPASKRNKFDKEVIKMNEKMNIAFMIFNKQILKIIPQTNCHECEWLSLKSPEKPDFAKSFSDTYKEAQLSRNWLPVKKSIGDLKQYQINNSSKTLASNLKINLEIIYNRINLFPKLAIIYLLLGLFLLVISFSKIIKGKEQPLLLEGILKISIIITFLIHISTFAIRWYISGYPPMSNGYETMLFISLITVGGGIIFSKRSQITYAISSLLASVLLMVASLSWFDPEITNQAPVLKSVWLVIHVAIITMSYGFFGIAALLGIFNLNLYIFSNNKNQRALKSTISELSVIIEIATITGLYFMTIGTFLGAIWANESWGRYWGWDPKEAWALITVFVYAIVVHMRNTKYFKGEYAISIASILAFSSVLMTYFGVNYFLSGMHSYAGSGPAEIPNWIYYGITAIVVLIFMSYTRMKSIEVEEKIKDKATKEHQRAKR
ncbi:MAG: cytochrome c biogenesis protein CcsA [Bacteroidota bacterium]